MREFKRKMMALCHCICCECTRCKQHSGIYADNVNSNQDNAPAIGAPANDDNTLEVYADPADEA